MTKVTPQTLKGFRDFSIKDTIKRQYVIAKIREVFELYGFDPIETPALEYLDTFTGSIGEDEKMFFKFEDQGGRKVALRYDQTVPTTRYVAQYRNNLPTPFKRYQIQPVWRSEKPQKGRYREFIQCDADIFGIAGPEADAEVIALTIDLYKSLGFQDFIVKINDRAILQDIPYPALVAIDKLAKVGEDGVLKEMLAKGFSKEQADGFLKKIMEAKPNETINTIFSYLKGLGIPEKFYAFEPTIIRSFSYSSGPIWEVIIPSYGAGSVLGGERYDKLVGRFQNEEVPATGFAVGFDRTLEAMDEMGLIPTLPTKAMALVTIFSPEMLQTSLKLGATLRQNKINTDVYTNPSDKLDKQLKYANRKAIPYVVIIGPDEVAKNTVVVKNMLTREQKEMSESELTQFFTSLK